MTAPKYISPEVARAIATRVRKPRRRSAWIRAAVRRAAIAAGCGSLTNTVLVLGLIYLLYRGHAHALYGVAVHALLPYLLTVVATNGIPEMVLAMVVVPPITWALARRGFENGSD